MKVLLSTRISVLASRLFLGIILEGLVNVVIVEITRRLVGSAPFDLPVRYRHGTNVEFLGNCGLLLYARRPIELRVSASAARIDDRVIEFART
jgi:hypothetical protein